MRRAQRVEATGMRTVPRMVQRMEATMQVTSSARAEGGSDDHEIAYIYIEGTAAGDEHCAQGGGDGDEDCAEGDNDDDRAEGEGDDDQRSQGGGDGGEEHRAERS